MVLSGWRPWERFLAWSMLRPACLTCVLVKQAGDGDCYPGALDGWSSGSQWRCACASDSHMHAPYCFRLAGMMRQLAPLATSTQSWQVLRMGALPCCPSLLWERTQTGGPSGAWGHPLEGHREQVGVGCTCHACLHERLRHAQCAYMGWASEAMALGPAVQKHACMHFAWLPNSTGTYQPC